MKSLLILSIVTLVSAGEQLSTSDQFYRNPTDHIFEHPLQVHNATQPVSVSSDGAQYTYPEGSSFTSHAALGSSNEFYINTYKSEASKDSSLAANSPVDQQQLPLGSYSTLVSEQNPSGETYSQPITNQDFNLTNLSVNGSSFGEYDTYTSPVTNNESSISVASQDHVAQDGSNSPYKVSLQPISNQGFNLSSNSNPFSVNSSSFGVYDSLSKPISTNTSYYETYTSPVTINSVNTNNTYPTKYSDSTYSSQSASSKPVSKFDSNLDTHSNLIKKHSLVSDFAPLTSYRLDAPTELGTTYSSYPNTFPLKYNSFPAKYISPSYVSRPTTYFSAVPYSATVTTYEAPSAVFSTPTQTHRSSFLYSKPVNTGFQSNLFSKSADATSFPKSYFNTVSASPYPTAFSTPATPVSYFRTYSTPATPTSYFTASTSPTTSSNLKTYSISSTPATFSTVYSTPASSTSYLKHTTPSAVFSTPTRKYGTSFHYSKPEVTDFQSNVFSKSADSTSFPKTYFNTVSDSLRSTTFSTPATPVSYFRTYSTPATPTSYYTVSTSPNKPASNLKTYSVSSTSAPFSTIYSTPVSSTSYLKHTTPYAVFSTPTQTQGSSFHYSKPEITDFQSNVFSKFADSTFFPKSYFNTVSASPYPTAFSTPATPVSYFRTYSTPATPTSYFTASTSPTTPAPNLKTYSITSTPATFSSVSSTPESSTSYFKNTTPAPPISYHTTSKPVEALPTSYSTVATGQDSSSSTFTPVTPQKISSVTVLNPETTYRSASYVEPRIAYESSIGINTTPSTPAIESTTYSTGNAANNSFYNFYSKPDHSSSFRTYSVPLTSFNLISRTNSIPVTHGTHLSGYSSSETPISDKTVYSTPVPISYSAVYSTPESYITPVNTQFLNPIAYSKIVDNQVPLRRVYSVPVSSSESYSFNAGPDTSYRSSSIYSLYPPSAYKYTLQRAPVTKEYHTLETPIASSWKTIDTWNVLPEQHYINA